MRTRQAAPPPGSGAVQWRPCKAMADVVLPILIGVVAALIALGVQRAWERRREGRGRPSSRIARLASWWAEMVRAARMMQTARTTLAKSERQAADAAPLPVSGRALPAEGTQPRARDGSAERVGTASTRRHPPDESSPRTRTSPKAARRPRGQGTIAVDPLDVPLDPRHARVVAGALIDDLEVGKIGRPE